MDIQIELFSSSSCSRCDRARQMVNRVVQDLQDDRLKWRVVNVVEALDYAVALGVLATPAIAINGRLAFTGLPASDQFRAALVAELRMDAPQAPS